MYVRPQRFHKNLLHKYVFVLYLVKNTSKKKFSNHPPGRTKGKYLWSQMFGKLIVPLDFPSAILLSAKTPS